MVEKHTGLDTYRTFIFTHSSQTDSTSLNVVCGVRCVHTADAIGSFLNPPLAAQRKDLVAGLLTSGFVWYNRAMERPTTDQEYARAIVYDI